jgi:hypothetical protein
VDKDGNFYAISFASRQLKGYEKNYSPFLLEAAAAVWGMYVFFLQILPVKTVHSLHRSQTLRKAGSLHNKTLNILQSAHLKHDHHPIQKWVKHASQLPIMTSATEKADKINSIAAFDPFQADLYHLQMKNKTLQTLLKSISTGTWSNDINKQDCNYLQILADRVFQDKNKIMWVRLNNYNYPRTVLYLPEKYQKEAMCEAHGHNTTQKTYLKISTSYYWLKKFQDIKKQSKFCIKCQQQKDQHTRKCLFRHSQYQNDGQIFRFMQIYLGQ